MTLQEFIAKYSDKTKGYPNDSSYSGECLSLVKIYIEEVFGIKAPASGSNSAYGYWSNFPAPLGTVFEKIANTAGVVPAPGDIPIWDPKLNGGPGHIDIAVYTAKTSKYFTGFDQNWSGKQAHLQKHDYTYIVGWLHPKKGITIPQGENNMTNMYGGLDLANPDSMKVCVDAFNAIKNGEYVKKVDAQAQAESAKKAGYDQGKSDGFNEGKASVPAPTPAQSGSVNMDEWKVNGLQISHVEGDKTITLNYDKK